MADAKKITKLPKLRKLQAPAERPKEEKMEHSEPSYWDQRPEFRIEAKDLPEIKTWEAGKEYTLVVKVKMEGKTDKVYDGESKVCGDFRMVSIGVAE